LQSSYESLPASDCECDQHGVHVDDAICMMFSEYVSTAQFVHAADPFKGLNLPAMQNWHVPPSGPE